MIYLFHGENDYLIKQEIKKLAQKRQAQVEEIQEITPGLATRLAQESLFGEKKLFVLQDVFSQLESLAFLKPVSQPQSTPSLVFWERKLDRRRQNTQWLLQNATVQEFKQLTDYAVEKWVQNWAKTQGSGQITAPAVRELIRLHGTNLYLLENELRKLTVWAGPKPIQPEHIQKLSCQSQEEKVFGFADAVGEKKRVLALAQLETLVTQKQDPVFLWAMLVRQIRLILEFLATSQLRNQHPFVRQKIEKQAQNWSLTEVKQKLALLVEYEYQVKTGQLKLENSLFLSCNGLSLSQA